MPFDRRDFVTQTAPDFPPVDGEQLQRDLAQAEANQLSRDLAQAEANRPPWERALRGIGGAILPRVSMGQVGVTPRGVELQPSLERYGAAALETALAPTTIGRNLPGNIAMEQFTRPAMERYAREAAIGPELAARFIPGMEQAFPVQPGAPTQPTFIPGAETWQQRREPIGTVAGIPIGKTIAEAVFDPLNLLLLGGSAAGGIGGRLGRAVASRGARAVALTAERGMAAARARGAEATAAAERMRPAPGPQVEFRPPVEPPITRPVVPEVTPPELIRPTVPPEGPGAAKQPWEMTLSEIATERRKVFLTFDELTSKEQRQVIVRGQKEFGSEFTKSDAQELTYDPHGKLPSDIGAKDLPLGLQRQRHRDAIQVALAEGKPVPPKVLAEYPDLAARPVVPEGPGAARLIEAEAVQKAAEAALRKEAAELTRLMEAEVAWRKEAARMNAVEAARAAQPPIVPEGPGAMTAGGEPPFGYQVEMPKPLTIREVEARARPLSPEERAVLPRQTQSAFFVPQDFRTATDNLITQFQKASPDNLQKLAELTSGTPVLRNVMHYLEPIGTAVARAGKGIGEGVIQLAKVRQDLYNVVEGSAARVTLLDWVGRNHGVLGLDEQGFAKSIQPKPGVGIPKKAVQRLDDILENLTDYILSPEQRAALREVQDTLNVMLEKQLALGLDIREVLSNYWPRIVRKGPMGEDPRRSITGYAKMRSFKTVREGIAKGYEYEDPLTALQARLTHGIENISWRNTWNEIKALGETPKERFQRESSDMLTGYKETVNLYKEARDAVKPARKAATAAQNVSLMEDALAKAEVAAENMVRAKTALRIARKRAAQPHMGEEMHYGRIFPEPVVKELGKYTFTEPGAFDEAARLYRATMVTGDLSQMFVQGANMLYRMPHNWVKASTQSIVATYKTPYDFVVHNIDTILDGVRAGAISPPTEMLLSEGGRWSQGFNRLPYVKQTQKAFEWFTFVGQTEWWKSIKGMEQVGLNKTEAATSVRKALGVVMRPGLTRGERQTEAYTLFATRFNIAVTSLAADVFRGGVQGAEARRTMGHLLAGATALTIGAQLAVDGKMPNFTDPDQKDFASVRTPGGVINFYGPMWSYIKAFATTGKHLVDGDYKKAAEGLTYMARGKLSATAGPLIDAITGKTIMGEDIDQEFPMGIIKAYLGRLGPIGVRQVEEQARAEAEGKRAHFPEVIGEVAGLRTSSFTMAQKRNQMRDTLAFQSTGKKWDDLGPLAQQYLRNTNPSIAQADLAAQAARPFTGELDMKEQLDAGNKMRERLPDNVQTEMKRLDVSLLIERNINLKSQNRVVVANYRLPDDQYDEYLKEVEALFKTLVPQWTSSAAYRGVPDDQKRAAWDKVKGAILERARQTIIARHAAQWQKEVPSAQR